MVVQNTPKKRIVWQDIRPIKVRPAPVEEAKLESTDKKRRFKISKPSKKFLLMSLAVIFILAAIGCLTWYFFLNKNSTITQEPTNQTSNNNNADTKTPVLTKGDPEFSTILPGGKDIASLGGWTRISPNDVDPVYAYSDTIGDVKINVSEQALPDSFVEDPDSELQSLAEGFNATQKITIDNFVVYIGTSIDGPQSVIFMRDNLLIMIKSTQIVSNNSWVSYIESLK